MLAWSYGLINLAVPAFLGGTSEDRATSTRRWRCRRPAINPTQRSMCMSGTFEASLQERDWPLVRINGSRSFVVRRPYCTTQPHLHVDVRRDPDRRAHCHRWAG